MNVKLSLCVGGTSVGRNIREISTSHIIIGTAGQSPILSSISMKFHQIFSFYTLFNFLSEISKKILFDI